MTHLDSDASLAVAQIAFFGAAIPFALAATLRQGMSRQAGWIFLVILCILRLIGGSATVYIHTHTYPPSTGLLELATITSSIGTAPLLMALLGLLSRIHAGLTKATRHHIPTRTFRIIHIITIIALIIAINGGIFRSSSKASKQSTGTSLSKASSIIFLAVFLVTAAITATTFTRRRDARVSDRRLVLACGAVLPFLLVRVVYLVIVSFTTDTSSVFYYEDVDVYITAVMQFLMEGIIVIVLTAVGLMVVRDM
jgi:hypothetical protein